MHRLVKIAGSCVLSAALILGVSPLASFGLQAASAADTPKETPTTEQDAQSEPVTYAAEALEEGDTFVYEDLTYTVTETDGTLEAMLGHFYHDDSDPYAPRDESAPTSSFTGGDVVLPGTATYEGVDYEVTAIDAYAFYNDTSITSLSIPASIITIGDYAFCGCSNISTLVLNEGLVTVGSYALAMGTDTGASSLKELTIPASVQTIEGRGFAYLRYLESLTFTDTETNPSRLESIGGSAFAAPSRSSLYYNNVLADIRIPASVTSINTAAFAYNAALKTVIFECDTTGMKYKTSSSTSYLSTAWFYGLTATEDTAIVFMQGAAPAYWDSSIPAYMCLDFYESEEKAAAADDAPYAKAAVAYDTPCSTMFDSPDEVSTFAFEDYTTVPETPTGDYTSWLYEGVDTLLLSVTSAGRVYPGNVDLNDLQYATVTIDGSPIPSSYDYDDFDVDAILASLQVVDYLGNTLTADVDYDARIEQPAPLGTVFLIIDGKEEHSGTYEQSIKVTLSAFTAADDAGHTFTYQVVSQPTFDDNGALVSNGTASLGDGSGVAFAGSVSSITELSVPEVVNETVTDANYSFGVVEVADEAFSGFTSLKTLDIPSTVTTIGQRAFYGCKTLSELNFTEGLVTIDDSAFGNCSALTEVAFPNSLLRLGMTSAFDSAGGSYVFNACTSLQKVTFGTLDGGGSAMVATRAFDGCNSLAEIDLNGNVDTLAVSALFQLSALKTFTGLYGLSSIGYQALYGCTSLSMTDAGEEGVLLLSDVTLNPMAFSGCTSLTTLRIGTGIVVGTASPGFTYSWAGGYIFSDTGITAIEFEEGWTSIPTSLFAGMDKLTSVSIPVTVTSIASSVFANCTSLASVTLPAGLVRLGASAFSGCISLTDVQFLGGESLNIEESVFSNCRSLQYISIPEGVTVLSEGCFSGCTSLEEVDLPSTLERIEPSCFGCSYDSLVETDQPVSVGCTSLKTLVIPASVTYIGIYAFDGCSSLTGPLDLTNVPDLEDYTFRDCASLDNITIAGDVSLGTGVFYGCESLTTLSDGSAASGVVLPEGIEKMGQNAFYGCSAIESLSVPAAIATVPQGAFSGCSSLIDLTLSEGVEAVGQESFANCTSLKTLATPASLTEIGISAFSGCSKLVDLQLAEGLESIGRQSFADCTSLPYVVLPSTISSIASGAFDNCYDLDAVDCTDIDTDAIDFAADAFTTGNTDTCLVFVQMDAPAGLDLDNGHVLSVTCPEKVTYTGKELTPVVLACTDGSDPADFCWVDYADNLIPGTASATVYVGAYEIPFTFEIENDGTYDPDNPPGTKQPITAGMVSNIPTQYYTGKAIKPAIRVGSYQQGSDYTVSYTNNVNIGTAKATITPSSEIGGTPVTKTFKITVKKNAA